MTPDVPDPPRDDSVAGDSVVEVTTLRLSPSDEEGSWLLADSAREEQATITSFDDQELSNHLELQWESPVLLGFDWPLGEDAQLEGTFWIYRGRFLRADVSLDDEEAVIQKRYSESPMVGKERLDAFRAAYLPPPWSHREWMAWLDARASADLEPNGRRESIPRPVRDPYGEEIRPSARAAALGNASSSTTSSRFPRVARTPSATPNFSARAATAEKGASV